MIRVVLDPNEVISTLILVVPGFVALSIALSGWGSARKIEAFSLTVWSIFLSALIDLVFIVVARIDSPLSAESVVGSLRSWMGILTYAAITVVVGLLGAFFFRFRMMDLVRKAVWYRSPKMRRPSLLWDDVLEAYNQRWVLLELEDGRRIQGFLSRSSTEDEPREIFLLEPREVSYDENGKPSYHPMEESIVVPGGRITAIRFGEKRAVVDNR